MLHLQYINYLNINGSIGTYYTGNPVISNSQNQVHLVLRKLSTHTIIIILLFSECLNVLCFFFLQLVKNNNT